MADVRRSIEAVWRIESARLIAGLARMVRDVGVAEELAQDALVTALESWPQTGVPDNPGAWLMATAKNRAIDRIRRDQRLGHKRDQIARELEPPVAPDLAAKLDDDVGDDLLRLVFTCCHPVLPGEARVALTLRLLGGLTTDEIARAFLVPEPTIAQRIVRAKRTLADKQVPFEVPRAAELADRLASVLEVIYLVFNEGHAATSGERWTRPELCEDALRLGRILAGLMPDESEVHGLVALMEIQASRLPARIDARGEPVLLLDQNRALWDQAMIRRGLAALDRATAPRATTRSRPRSPRVTLVRASPPTPTGSRSRRSTRRSSRPCRRRSSSSIARSPWAWPSGRRLGSRSPIPSSTTSRTITCCRACAAISSRSWAARTKHERSSCEPPR